MASAQTPFAPDRMEALTQAIREHWPLLLAEGIILLALGVAAIAVPPLGGLVTTLFLGLVLFAAGVAGLVSTFRGRELPGFWWSLVSAVLPIIIGALLVWRPVVGMMSLTGIMTGSFIADGVLTIFLALRHRDRLVGRWQWLLTNGVIDLIIAALIIRGLPGTLVWAPGLLVGVDLLAGGSVLIAISLRTRGESTGQPAAVARHAA